MDAKGMGGVTSVSDGVQTWTHNGYLKQYTNTTRTEPLAKALNAGLGATLSVDRPGATAKSAKLTGEESLTVGSRVRQCYRIEVTYEDNLPGSSKSGQSPTTYWVDEGTYLVLKTASARHLDNFPAASGPADMKVTVSVEALRVNEPLPAELFTFTPPVNAKLVETFEYPGMKKPDMVGKQAPDFKLRDLLDKEVHLASARGKTVLLDFWTTWCAPCREEIPVIQKLREENRDLVVFGIDVGEDGEVVQKFVKDNHITYPILLAGQDTMVDDYAAHAFPTVVVIDKAGVVRTYKTGYSPEVETQLRAAIADAAKPATPMLPSASAPGEVGGTGIGTGRRVYKVGGGVTAPSVIYKTVPEYSEEARRAHVSGTVVLSTVISPEGYPQEIQVVRGIGSGLDENAILTLSKWRFQPGVKDGRSVAVQASIEVNFRTMDNRDFAPMEADGNRHDATEVYRDAMHLIRTRNIEGGIKLLSQAIALKPDWAQAYIARARALSQVKRYAEAIPDFDTAIHLDPKNAPWYDGRGLAYSYAGRHARAIEDYTRAVEMAQYGSPSPYNDRGWAYLELGQPETAIPDLTQAVQIAPDFAKAYENRAQAYGKLKDWPHAIADFTAAIQLNPTMWNYQRRADARRSAGDNAGADEDMRKADKLSAAPAMSSQLVAQQLPKPALVYNGSRDNGLHFIQYTFAVSNYSEYPDELFRPAPDLPPCGLNDDASRMWVEIFDDDQQRLYGFCALKAPAELQKLWFAIPEGKQPPAWIRVVLKDRQTGQTTEGRLAIPKR